MIPHRASVRIMRMVITIFEADPAVLEQFPGGGIVWRVDGWGVFHPSIDHGHRDPERIDLERNGLAYLFDTNVASDWYEPLHVLIRRTEAGWIVDRDGRGMRVVSGDPHDRGAALQVAYAILELLNA